jgi:hypothetical protein
MILQLWWKYRLRGSNARSPGVQSRQFLIESVLELLTIVEAAILLDLRVGILRDIASILKVSSWNIGLGLTWATSYASKIRLVLRGFGSLDVLGLSKVIGNIGGTLFRYSTNTRHF